MSLIHEALEKIERQKPDKKKFTPYVSQELLQQSGSVTINKPKETPVHSWTVYGIVGVLVLSLVLGLVFFLRPTEEQAGKTISGQSPQSSTSRPSWNHKDPKFILTGITQIAEEHTAILNNQIVRVGDEIDGAKVEVIAEDEVVLRFGNQKFHIGLHSRHGAHFTELHPVS